MTNRWSGAGLVALTATVATCGLLLLGGTPPAGGSTGEPTSDTSTPTTTNTTTTSIASTSTTTTSTTEPVSTIATTTTPEPTTTTSPTTTSPTTAEPGTTLRPAPPSVAASATVVGLGGRVTFEGTCTTGHGPVVVWITDDGRATTTIVDTGLTTSPWTYVWTAPADGHDAASFAFRFWCGDPTTVDGDGSTRVRIDMVASDAPTTNPASITPATSALPETA